MGNKTKNIVNQNKLNYENLLRENAALLEENKVLKQKLSESQTKQKWQAYRLSLFKRLLENIPDALYFKDIKSRFIEVSKSMKTIFNLNEDQDILGKTDFDIQDKKHAEEAFSDEQEIIQTGNPLINILEKETKNDGSIRWVSTTKLPLKDENGQIIGVFGISRDISELIELKNSLLYKNEELQAAEEELRQSIEELHTIQDDLLTTKSKAETQNDELRHYKEHLESIIEERTKAFLEAKEQAEESDNLKSAFLANISHEIRTPMNAILGFTNLLKDYNLNMEQKQYIDNIYDSAKSLMVLIHNVIDLSMIETKQLNINIEPFFLNEFINDVYISVMHNHQKDAVNFELKNMVDDQNIIVNSDDYRIKQILLNLLKNAQKYTSIGSIELRVNATNDVIIFQVEDSGIGMHQEDLEYIFERFRKIEIDKAQLYRGAGLGLAISNKLATLLNGKLSAISASNEGSCFTLSIPR